MNLKNLSPWNWFKKEEEREGAALPVEVTNRLGLSAEKNAAGNRQRVWQSSEGVQHGETVLNFLTPALLYELLRIICHSQVVRYTPYLTRQLFDCGSNAIFADGFNEAYSEATQAGYISRSMIGAYRAAIFIPIPVEYKVMAFYFPMASVEIEHPLYYKRLGGENGKGSVSYRNL